MFDNNSAVIIAGGQNYNAWQSFSIRREFGNGIPVFEFSPVEGAYGDLYQNLALDVGDAVQITLSGQLALTGVVNSRSASMDKGSHQISIAGRSNTGYAADSSVNVKPGSMNGYTLEQAANAVLSPLGINFTLQNGGDIASMPFPKLMPRVGEYVHQFVGRMCKMRGVFVSGDENGHLIASKHTTDANSSATFSIGSNIISIHAKMENAGVTSAYQVVGQLPASDQSWPGRSASASLQQPAGVANTKTVVVGEIPVPANQLPARAEHEAAVSTWTTFQCTIEVNGWTDANGALWNPLGSTRVSVYAPGIFPKAPYLVECGIQAATFKQDSESGSTTSLELTLPNLLSGSASSGASIGPQSGGGDYSNVGDPSAQTDPSDSGSYST